ncbi:MAG: hypothetical protein HQL31_05875 [Planctomycetes bacterium]|nr:hypothetical protein [Planctomycetota bacterium]
MPSLTPADILAEVPRDKILVRLASLKGIYSKFEKQWGGTYLCEDLLLHCVENAFCDLGRMKAFHDIENGDQHKRAAFTARWIVKIRPIMIHNGDLVTKHKMFVNEFFAIHAGLHHLNISIKKIPKPLLSNLLYTLHYRDTGGEILSTLMYTTELIAKR